MRTRGQTRGEPKPPPASSPASSGRGGAEEVAAGGANNRRRASPAAKGKSPATNARLQMPVAGQVELESSLGIKRKKGKVNTERNDDTGKKRCSVGSSEKKKLEEKEPEAIGDNDAAGMEWEDGHVSPVECKEGYSHDLGETVTVEFTDVPSSTEKKSVRRHTAEEKELAELMHKVHLLCLLARGRVIDKACNDPLIQASVLSVLPQHLLWNGVDTLKLDANKLRSLVNWFHRTFCIIARSADKGSFESNMAFALQSHEGTAEEVCALSVALFRALNLTARFVTNMDVVGLKPDAKAMGTPNQDGTRLSTRALPCSPVAAGHNEFNTLSPARLEVNTEHRFSRAKQRGDLGNLKRTSACKSLSKNLSNCKADQYASTSKDESSSSPNSFTSSNAEIPKRKGDVEFELQLQMALSATGAEIQEMLAATSSQSIGTLLDYTPLKKLRKNAEVASNSSAVWSRSGPPLYWAEVYCGGQTLTGKWVHVDVVNDIIDGERKVEAASAVCRKPLRYVVAFAGGGAKDVTRSLNRMTWSTVLLVQGQSQKYMFQVTKVVIFVHLSNRPSVLFSCASRYLALSLAFLTKEILVIGWGFGERYCLQWHRIVQGRVNPEWWEKVLAPLEQLELAATNDSEDMELQTRALTEPLPTNQQAYRDHHLYALEKWLHKNQVLHPKGPVLGFCKGHPVYPRSCVQTLQSRHGWLTEGLQVRENESPAKIVTRPKRIFNSQSRESNSNEDELQATTELYGKWQLEPLQLPGAVNGIVPKNERGQVDVWSEKCLPPGTVHLSKPRIFQVAKRLGIDYAPAMIGFDYRSGRCAPVYDGIVVCAEFKNAILEAYKEEEERRQAAERKQEEAQALSRWYQLLCSIVTRQRLKESYNARSAALAPERPAKVDNPQKSTSDSRCSGATTPNNHPRADRLPDPRFSAHDHEHEFPEEDQSFDEETFVRTKRCPCGFSLQVEEL
ncbi:DNA repair protein RAD4 isoform X2 [Aegilops tauschii subsp. strangulata]|uniref:DNA repair complementing XP-C cells-like protein n=1 Tax=Aegilops tauschii TaxID=37682 RepID=M8C8K9_AEGTA